MVDESGKWKIRLQYRENDTLYYPKVDGRLDLPTSLFAVTIIFRVPVPLFGSASRRSIMTLSFDDLIATGIKHQQCKLLCHTYNPGVSSHICSLWGNGSHLRVGE